MHMYVIYMFFEIMITVLSSSDLRQLKKKSSDPLWKSLGGQFDTIKPEYSGMTSKAVCNLHYSVVLQRRRTGPCLSLHRSLCLTPLLLFCWLKLDSFFGTQRKCFA